MKKPIDWTNHILEFSVVVIGILLAFQLNKCSLEKTQMKTVQSHLGQIYVETELNKENLSATLAHAERNLSYLDTLINDLSDPTFKNFKKANNLTFKLLNISGVYLRKNAYKLLVESGDLRLIKDFKTKDRIVNLYEFYDWVEGIEKIAIQNYSDRFFPYISNNFDLVNSLVQKEDIYRSKVFLNSLSTYRYSVYSKIDKYKKCLEEVEEYLE